MKPKDEPFFVSREHPTSFGLVKEPKQEPVAWITQGGKGWLRWHKSYDDNKDSVPLYTSPPQRQPLTDEEIVDIVGNCAADSGGWFRYHAFARAIEAAHGIKENT